VSLQLRLLTAIARGIFKPMVAHADDPVALRARFERIARRVFRLPPASLVREITLAPDIPALAISNRPGSHPPRAHKLVLYFHGGAFVAGSPRTHAALLARLARLARVEIIAPSYRLAPEHPFPAAPDDARAAWDALIARGYRAGDIALGGDSAGGNLALGLLAGLLAEGQRPAGLFAFSPVTDLTFSGPTITSNVRRDSMLPSSRTADLLGYYLPNSPADDPRASPLFARFPDPPPVFLQYAATEILADDCRRIADRLRDNGGEVICDEWPDAPHVWVIFDGYVPEAREGLRRAARFVSAVLEPDQASAIAPAIR
jgi:epsilon-lactone hydrolase